MSTVTAVIISAAIVGAFAAGMLVQALRRHRIAGIARPIAGLRSAAVVAKQRDGEPIAYYMIGPQRRIKAEADADLERWRRAQIMSGPAV